MTDLEPWLTVNRKAFAGTDYLPHEGEFPGPSSERGMRLPFGTSKHRGLARSFAYEFNQSRKHDDYRYLRLFYIDPFTKEEAHSWNEIFPEDPLRAEHWRRFGFTPDAVQATFDSGKKEPWEAWHYRNRLQRTGYLEYVDRLGVDFWWYHAHDDIVITLNEIYKTGVSNVAFTEIYGSLSSTYEIHEEPSDVCTRFRDGVEVIAHFTQGDNEKTGEALVVLATWPGWKGSTALELLESSRDDPTALDRLYSWYHDLSGDDDADLDRLRSDFLSGVPLRQALGR